MYYTALPDHTTPGFDEASHFSQFNKNNIIFNTRSSHGHCDNHVGCLSFKTVFEGEEWYGINGRQLAVRSGGFLMLNDHQNYSFDIRGTSTKSFSIFFKRELAFMTFHDALQTESKLLDNPFALTERQPEFFQTLYQTGPLLREQLGHLLWMLESSGYDCGVDEYLISILQHLLIAHISESRRSDSVDAVKVATKSEIYKRLCIARDFLHSFYMEELDLTMISRISCLSVPQLIRHFRSVFHTTPHRYLVAIRMRRAAELLTSTDRPVHEIAVNCGFEDVSAFCRAFKTAHGVTAKRYLP